MEIQEINWLQPLLATNEYVVWKGQPGKGSLLGKEDAFWIPFSIMWCGFVIFWEWTAIATNESLIFQIFGIPFVLIGLYLLFGRLIQKRYILSRTQYVITNRHIFFKYAGKILTLDRENLPAMNFTLSRNGLGTIDFENCNSGIYTNFWQMRFTMYRWPYRSINYELKNIPDAQKVWKILCEST